MIRSYNEIFNDLQSSFLANQDKITDMNKAGIMRSFLVAVATEEARKYLETEMAFNDSIKKIPASIFGFDKKTGTYATGKVRFGATSNVPYEVIIPKGTKVSGEGFTYITQKIAKINQGEMFSNEVSVTAESVGEAQNLPANSIGKIETTVPEEVKSVTNLAPFENGTNVESVEKYLIRFNDYINGLQGSNFYGLKSACLGVNGVSSVSVVEGFDLTGLYDVTIFAEDGSGNLSDEKLEEIRNVINGDGSPTNPGKRSPGINVEVTTPTVINLSVAVTCEFENADLQQSKHDIETSIRSYLNSLAIGQDVIGSDIIREIRTYSYVKDAYITQLTSGELEENDEGIIVPTKIQIAQNQVARFATCDVNMVSISTGE